MATEEVRIENGKHALVDVSDLVIPFNYLNMPRLTTEVQTKILPDFIFIRPCLRDIFVKEFRQGIISANELIKMCKEHNISFKTIQ